MRKNKLRILLLIGITTLIAVNTFAYIPIENTPGGNLEYVCLVGGACIAGPPEDPGLDITPYNIIPIDSYDNGVPIDR